MGWDAFATLNGKDLRRNWGTNERLVMPDLHKRFTEASDEVRNKTGTVDWLLRLGALDCSACANALQQATGLGTWSEIPWDAETVKRLADSASWDDVDTEPWAKESARAFLNTCAELGLGIRFSF